MFDNALKVSTSTKYYLSNKSVLNSRSLEYTPDIKGISLELLQICTSNKF